MKPPLTFEEGIESVAGFRTMGVHCGIKNERPDMALIVSDCPGTTAAAVFTQNSYAAAPVHLGRQHVADGNIQAIVCNSGNANACTGRQGLRDALEMSRTTARLLGLQKEQVLVCSTGIIGEPLPMDKVLEGIRTCTGRMDAAKGGEAAKAILTTDSGPKTASQEITVAGTPVRIAGMAKGAGMIHPNMATMLAFMATDAKVPADALRTALKTATDVSFNQISIDGDESTNDTAAIMASGASGAETLHPYHEDWPAFQDGVTAVCQDLAKQIAADGEGATRLFEVRVTGAKDDKEARLAAKSIASSNLVKAAIHGSDPNWGRIVSSVGQCRVAVDADQTSVWVGQGDEAVPVLEDGVVTERRDDASRLLQRSSVHLRIDLHVGEAEATAWGCDLTPDYVTFNSEYTT